jgi:hypothetical protein
MNTGIFNLSPFNNTNKHSEVDIINKLYIKNNKTSQIAKQDTNKIFDDKKWFYICSSGGCGSTLLYKYLTNFGNVEHIHDRYPPEKLEFVGKRNSTEDTYSEWFNKVTIPENEIHNYKVIFIYRDAIDVIYSRFGGPRGPNINHLKHVMCKNEGNIHLNDVIYNKKDLYELEEFFDNYVYKTNKNYSIYCIKYENFFDNIEVINKILEIPNIKSLYPTRIERKKKKKKIHVNILNAIYDNLKLKMKKMRAIQII